MLNIESLSVTHNGNTLLEPVSFTVDTGNTLVIMGETGAGKSLIAQCIMGVLPSALKSSGAVFVDGQRLDKLGKKAQHALWGRSLVMLPQEPWHALDPLMRSYKQVYETHRLVKGLSPVDAHRHTENDFKELNLDNAMQQRPGQLSGGMSQRVAFAAASAGGGNLFIADEPTKGLDSDTCDLTLAMLNKVPEQGGTLIVITHDMSVARNVGGEILVLKEGVLVESGSTCEVLDSPSHAYTKSLIAADPGQWSTAAKLATDEPLLETQNLIVGREKIALNSPLNLSLPRNGRLALQGPSGVGKTTLLDTIAGLMKPLSGRINYQQTLSATDIQKIYQDPPSAFAPHVFLKRSLADVARLHKVPWQDVEALLTRLSVDASLLNRLPSAVSGGELQRIAIIRALIVKPRILLADEPTSRLDPITQMHTMNLLDEVAQANQTAVLLVTHDSEIARKWASNSISLSA